MLVGVYLKLSSTVYQRERRSAGLDCHFVTEQQLNIMLATAHHSPTPTTISGRLVVHISAVQQIPLRCFPSAITVMVLHHLIFLCHSPFLGLCMIGFLAVLR